MPFAIKYTGNAHRTIPEHNLEWLPQDGKRVQSGIKDVALVHKLLTYPRPEFVLDAADKPTAKEIDELAGLMKVDKDVISAMISEGGSS